ncbi:MAG TPA: hypothetical protein VJC13_02965 [Candidatus Paceibacterota bacterium]
MPTFIVTDSRHLEALLKMLLGQRRELQALEVLGPWHAFAKGALLADLQKQIEYAEGKLSACEQVASKRNA